MFVEDIDMRCAWWILLLSSRWNSHPHSHHIYILLSHLSPQGWYHHNVTTTESNRNKDAPRAWIWFLLTYFDHDTSTMEVMRMLFPIILPIYIVVPTKRHLFGYLKDSSNGTIRSSLSVLLSKFSRLQHAPRPKPNEIWAYYVWS